MLRKKEAFINVSSSQTLTFIGLVTLPINQGLTYCWLYKLGCIIPVLLNNFNFNITLVTHKIFEYIIYLYDHTQKDVREKLR